MSASFPDFPADDWRQNREPGPAAHVSAGDNVRTTIPAPAPVNHNFADSARIPRARGRRANAASSGAATAAGIRAMETGDAARAVRAGTARGPTAVPAARITQPAPARHPGLPRGSEGRREPGVV